MMDPTLMRDNSQYPTSLSVGYMYTYLYLQGVGGQGLRQSWDRYRLQRSCDL